MNARISLPLEIACCGISRASRELAAQAATPRSTETLVGLTRVAKLAEWSLGSRGLISALPAQAGDGGRLCNFVVHEQARKNSVTNLRYKP
jgi:hypothetical protein